MTRRRPDITQETPLTAFFLIAVCAGNAAAVVMMAILADYADLTVDMLMEVVAPYTALSSALSLTAGLADFFIKIIQTRDWL